MGCVFFGLCYGGCSAHNIADVERCWCTGLVGLSAFECMRRRLHVCAHVCLCTRAVRMMARVHGCGCCWLLPVSAQRADSQQHHQQPQHLLTHLDTPMCMCCLLVPPDRCCACSLCLACTTTPHKLASFPAEVGVTVQWALSIL